jgi:hypothetical protein
LSPALWGKKASKRVWVLERNPDFCKAEGKKELMLKDEL